MEIVDENRWEWNRNEHGLTIPKPYAWRAGELVHPLVIMLTSAFATFVMLYF